MSEAFESESFFPRQERFLAMIADDRPHLFDGGFGTELHYRGVSVTRCFDELNLSRPELVTKVHVLFLEAGAEILETNTYGANRPKLAPFGFEDRVGEINRTAAGLAREVAGDRALVAGAMGPLGVRMEPFGPTAREEVRAYFKEQAEALLEGGVDLFVLETFGITDELVEAIRGVKEAGDLPVVAQMTVGHDLHSGFGTDPEHFVPRLESEGIDVLGLNCSVGPQAMLQGIERIRPLTSLPLSAVPNSGLPREVEGRKIYVASPEYMGDYARRLVQAGVRFVGGCCGTGPEHIKRMAVAIRPLHPLPAVAKTSGRAERRESPAEEIPLAERSNLGRKLASGEPFVSVEIVPPRGGDPSEMLAQVETLKGAGVDAGAEFAISQPVFDVAQMEGFLEELERRDLKIPVVGGIWPLVSLRNAEFLANEVPGIHVPDTILSRMRAASAKGSEHAVREGISIARETWESLGPALQGIQVNAPFGRVHLALQVLEDLPGI